jgi:hypothetical protein
MDAHGGPNSTEPPDWDDAHAPPDAPGDLTPPMPPIQGVRPMDAFDATEPEEPALRGSDQNLDPDAPVLHLIPAAAIDPWGVEPAMPTAPAVDPWGLHDAPVLSPAPVVVERDELPPELSDDEPAAADDPDDVQSVTPRRGGGTLTIPLLCIGVAIIAWMTLLPLADENHRLAWERQKLQQDLAHLREQVQVNDEFLRRVADDASLAERLAQRQMRYIRQGSSVLKLGGGQGKNQEMSPFHLVAVPPPRPLPAYQPVGGVLAALTRNPRTQLYMSGAALLLIAAGLVLGYVPRARERDRE